MLLLFNVKITDQRFTNHPRAPWLHNYNRAEVFRYCISSMSVLKPFISRSIFFVTIGSDLLDHGESVYSSIFEHFPQAEIYGYRNNTTVDWRNSWHLIEKNTTNPNELVFFGGNDDHIFMDYDTTSLKIGLELLQNDDDENSLIYYSHWYEQCRNAHYRSAEFIDSANWLKYYWGNFDSLHILKLARLRSYYFDYDLKDNDKFYRHEELQPLLYPDINAIPDKYGPVYVPTRRMFEHYDGYNHINWHYNKSDKLNVNNYIPPLTIPPGFFDSKIKIRIGYTTRYDDCVNLNPMSKTLYSVDINGTDYRWLEKEIPLFWQDRIVDIDVAPGYNHEQMIKSRNDNLLQLTRIPMTIFSVTHDSELVPPINWFKSQML